MKKTLMTISSLVFATVAILHLLRAVYGLPVILADFSLPIWASYTAFLFIGTLAILNWKER